MNKYLKIIYCVAICLTVGYLSSNVTQSSITTWYPIIKKPVYNPPNWVFAPVWTLLFIMMGIAAGLIWNKLETSKDLVKKGDGTRIVHDVEIVNVVAIQKGTKFPNRFIIMSGDIDSRVSDPTDFTSDSPGANDNASGMAGTIEAARVLSKYKLITVLFMLVYRAKNKDSMAEKA
jgi:hypothetical protein